MSLPIPDEYSERIETDGFVGATSDTIRLVLENTARIDQLTKTLDQVVKALGPRLEALERRPDVPAKPVKP